MPVRYHEVRRGETLLSIARDLGFRDWELIWNDPGNENLREKRSDPQVLAVGDRVFIPEKTAAQFTIRTGARHAYEVKQLGAWYRSVILDEFGEPMRNATYRLELADEVLEGTTDDSGKIELLLSPRPFDGTLIVTEPGGRRLTWHLRLGDLDPIDNLTGVKARLANLGFRCGAINEEMNDETRRALRDFQIVFRLPVTALADDPTREKLLAAHDQR